ncbi:unnamed protein product [Thelazia callipaeda]|uniref:Transmembrane protein n=1 Tax=Thelazia callipaeda TaxID=103827 RepID=A0A0N5D8F0_THECL|nr:unnamed protein product [Thelazia callipaeda]
MIVSDEKIKKDEKEENLLLPDKINSINENEANLVISGTQAQLSKSALESIEHQRDFLRYTRYLRRMYRLRVLFAAFTFTGACLMGLSAAVAVYSNSCREQWSQWSKCHDATGFSTRYRCAEIEKAPCECPSICSSMIEVAEVSSLPKLHCSTPEGDSLMPHYAKGKLVLKASGGDFIATPRCSP